MDMRLFKVTLEGPDGARDITVPSPTEVQAADAAAVQGRADEAIISIVEVEGELGHPDAAPPTTQSVQTPGPGMAS